MENDIKYNWIFILRKGTINLTLIYFMEEMQCHTKKKYLTLYLLER